MIQVENLSLHQGGFSLKAISFDIPDGCYAALMGRSGCGKTTVIEAICGLRKIQAGTIRLSDRDVTQLTPAERNISYVPQDVALFPTYTVRDQLAFSLIVRDVEEAVIEERVNRMAELLGLSDLLDRKPVGLSGGEAKRVALGRALVPEPEVICLDEPLSNLDEETQEETLSLLQTALKDQGVTVLHVTHSKREAERLADLRLSFTENGVV